MGKKFEKAVKGSKDTKDEESEDRTPEPYQCTGQFHTDFNELCKQNGMYRPPLVLPRPKPPPSPSLNPGTDSTQQGGKRGGKEDKRAAANAQLEEEQESQEDKEIIELLGFKPRTFTVKDSLEYMKPVVHVEMDHPEKQDTVTEIFIRGWLMNAELTNTFTQCIVKLNRLHSLHFWRVALNSQTIKELAETLNQCEQIKLLQIDANEKVEEQNWWEFITENSNLTKLILRYCHVDAAGAKSLAEQLATTKKTNVKLLCLDLAGNHIGDEGAGYLATALRTNRTLLQLSLSNNDICDAGCKALAEVVSRFFLTHDEIIERRFLMSEKNMSGRVKSASTYLESRPDSSIMGASPPPSRRGDKDRPGSVRSNDRDSKGGTKGGRDSKSSNKKGGKDAKDKDEKGGKGKKDDKGTIGKKEPSSRGTKGGSTAAESKTAGKGKGGKGAKGSKTVVSTEVHDLNTFELPESTNPLMEKADESVESGKLLIPGNYVLLMLNLSRNRITEKGVEEFKLAVNYQSIHMLEAKVNGTGLLKLLLKGNSVPTDSAVLQKLEDMMAARDPFYKPPPKSPGPD